MTQWLIEEALAERVDMVESRIKQLSAGATLEPDIQGGDLGDFGVSPGASQSASHAARMAALTAGR